MSGATWSTEAIGVVQPLQDFTLALAIDGAVAAPAKEVVLVEGKEPQARRLGLSWQPDGAVRFQLRVGDVTHEIQTRSGAMPTTGAAVKVAVSVRRDPRQALAGLWINGVELATAAIPPGEVVLKAAEWEVAKALPQGAKWRQLDVYGRALTRGELLDWGLLAAGEPASQTQPQASGLVVLGGSEAVMLMEEGTLEALFVSQQESRSRAVPFVRSLAWEGDTVFAQDRPMNFGSLRQQLQRSEAGVALLMFGRQECLERGREGVESFRTALSALVGSCRAQVPEIWLAGLPPFEKQSAPLPDLSARNEELAVYDAAIREVAKTMQATFIDLRSVWPPQARDFTTDGVNLSSKGAALTAQLLLSAEELPEAERLRALARAKNRLWNQYWRPTNWAFLHGDRTAQPSSRDHANPRLRWFPEETETYWRLIEAKEKELAQAVSELRRKLP